MKALWELQMVEHGVIFSCVIWKWRLNIVVLLHQLKKFIVLNGVGGDKRLLKFMESASNIGAHENKFLFITFACFVFYAASVCYVFLPFVQAFKFSKLSKTFMCTCYFLFVTKMCVCVCVCVCVSFMLQKCACNFSLKLSSSLKAFIAFDVSP